MIFAVVVDFKKSYQWMKYYGESQKKLEKENNHSDQQAFEQIFSLSKKVVKFLPD